MLRGSSSESQPSGLILGPFELISLHNMFQNLLELLDIFICSFLLTFLQPVFQPLKSAQIGFTIGARQPSGLSY